MNVSGGTIYSMYKQEKYVNKKLDPQKKSVHSRGGSRVSKEGGHLSEKQLKTKKKKKK